MQQRKATIYKLKGCEKCIMKCLFNRPTATKEVSEQYKSLFACNSEAEQKSMKKEVITNARNN